MISTTTSYTENTTETSTTSSSMSTTTNITDYCSESSYKSTTSSKESTNITSASTTGSKETKITNSLSTATTCQKWLTKKCILYKYKRNGSHLILEKMVLVKNTDLCDRIDKNFKQSAIDKLNEEKDIKIEENKKETLAKIDKINEEYKLEILTNKSFSYVAIVFIALLFTFVILMDITKINLFKNNLPIFDRKTNNQITTVDDLTYKKVRNLNQEINKKMNYKPVKN